MPSLHPITFDTSYGWIAVVLDGSTIRRIALGHPTESAARRAVRDEIAAVATHGTGRTAGKAQNASDTRLGDSLAARIRAYCEGIHDDFRDLAVDMAYLTPLGRQVFEQCRRIPYGRTRTYAELAAAVGRPGAARAVGNFMASNRTPIVVPCHRVVASGGRLGGFTAPGGAALKQRLLELESAWP
ncbi:MAG: methylated-DNA--[protein]-cysteine S-methyltransferase [Pirellulaceae bacterium]|nr:methylated-DNA--[protein]-cysteine S-methyltransferase [Pirellulaceae bacterium]